MCQWQNTQEKCRIETVPAQVTLLPKREWVGLTDDEVDALESATDTLEFPQTVKAIEAKLRSKNNDS
jgi:pyruvate/2-oxoglutarate dehydrogenase complex dihydrolipoamide dehydrogenase (E3) component